MAGIQTRGRNRINTNKIQQLKAVNKVNSQLENRTTENKHIINSSNTPNQTTATSNIQKDEIKQKQNGTYVGTIEKGKLEEAGKRLAGRRGHNKVKARINTDPQSKIMLGMGNTVKDYGGIVQGGYEDKSILNRSIGLAIEGDWDGAGKLIQDNPYRFAGNLIVEAGTAVIPVGAVLKVAKIAKVTDKVLKNVKKVIPKKTIDGEEIKTLYTVRPAGEGPGMWYANIAEGFYHNKIVHGGAKTIGGNLVKDGVPQLRSVDVPKSVYEKFKVSEILKKAETRYIAPNTPFGDLGSYWSTKADAFVPMTTSYAKTPRYIVDRMRMKDETLVSSKQLDPNAIGEHRSSEFLTKLTKENTPSGTPDEIIRQKNLQSNEKIAAHLKLNSFDPTNEWALKHRWQKTEKIVATAGQKESVFKRIINPGLSSDKYANELANTYKKKNKTVKELDWFENSHQKYGDVDNPPSFNKARDMLQKSEQGGQLSPLSYNMFAVATGVGGLQVLSKNNTVKKGKGKFKPKSSQAKEWDPMTPPPALFDMPPIPYDKPFWADESKAWMQDPSPFDPWPSSPRLTDRI